MRILPVLDIKDGTAVHAVGGRRENYRPLNGAEGGLAGALRAAIRFRDELGLTELYLADLDAIAGAAPRVEFYQELRGLGIRLHLDAGSDSAEKGALVIDSADVLIVGLESVKRLEHLAKIVERLGADRLAFSLDLRDGRPIRPIDADWRPEAPETYVAEALALGLRRFILLDLSRVGTGTGTGTESLLERVVPLDPLADWIVGGGIRTIEDVRAAQSRGATGALIGTALHDGRITREAIASLPR